MLKSLFIDHPASVNETYLEHLGVASRFGGRLILIGLACFVHGIVPGCFKTTGSDEVRRLNERLQSRRPSAQAHDGRTEDRYAT